MSRGHRGWSLKAVATGGLLAVLLALTACGSSGAATTAQKNSALLPGALPKPTSVTLVLDYIPNAVHAGIFRPQG